MSSKGKKPSTSGPGGVPSTAGASQPGGGESGNPTDASKLIQQDPTTLLYIQAATLAFPHLEQNLIKYTSETVKKTADAKQDTEVLQNALAVQVQQYVVERAQICQDITQLKKNLDDTIQNIANNKKQFAESKMNITIANVVQLETMRKQIIFMSSERKQATHWLSDRDKKIILLAKLEKRIEEKNVEHKKDLEAMHAEHEEEKRKMRDVLIRRLRKVRDVMSSTNDDDEDSAETGGGGGGSASGLLPGGGGGPGGKKKSEGDDTAFIMSSSAPTAKSNEKMARAVTLYEREACTVSESISEMSTELQQSTAMLAEQRKLNEKLVLRNASHIKTRSVLSDQVREVTDRYTHADKRQQEDILSRKQTITDTANSQSEILFHLQGELDFSLEEYETAKLKLRALQKEMHHKGSAVAEANKFFTETAMMLNTPVSKKNEIPPLSKAGLTTDTSDFSSKSGIKKDTPHEAIPALMLKTPTEIASFFSAALCSY